jgi:tetratricopeptide (TPR) repeat protein
VGKTALAVHVAHRLRARFGDGQLYVDLQGATAGLRPLAPLEVLGRFLRALGADPAVIPTGVEEAAAAWRSRVAGRRLLVVLDNAVDAGQVAPLLPGSPGCGVLVTSRRVLAGLAGAVHLHLDVLAPEEAKALLGRIASPARIAAEPQAAAEIARLCGYLPLALRIAGARLAARPAWPLAALADRLGVERERLAELEVTERGVRASLAVSYGELRRGGDPTDCAAGAFGLLGALDGPDFGVPVVTRLLDQPDRSAEGVLERLVDAQLLETPSPGRYRMHDLVRLYARELAASQYAEPDRTAALARALGFYVATAWRTLALLRSGDFRLTRIDERWTTGGLELAGADAALEWLEAERANLLATVRQAASTPGVPVEIAFQLSQALYGFFWLRNYWGDWVRVNQTALEAASRVGDLAAQAQAANDLGLAHSRQGRYEQALTHLQQSLASFRKLDDRYGQAVSLSNLGLVYEWQRRYEQALACQRESLDISRELGDRAGQAHSLGNLGNIYMELERYQEALRYMEECLGISRELGAQHSEAVSLGNLGTLYARLGRNEEALACLRESLAGFQELGTRDGEAYSLNDLGVVYQRQGRHDDALDCLRRSLAIRRRLGDPKGQAESLRHIGDVLQSVGRKQEARAAWQEALAIFEKLGLPEAEEVRALLATLSPVGS